jgi:hypothetical protein
MIPGQEVEARVFLWARHRWRRAKIVWVTPFKCKVQFPDGSQGVFGVAQIRAAEEPAGHNSGKANTP